MEEHVRGVKCLLRERRRPISAETKNRNDRASFLRRACVRKRGSQSVSRVKNAAAVFVDRQIGIYNGLRDTVAAELYWGLLEWP